MDDKLFFGSLFSAILLAIAAITGCNIYNKHKNLEAFNVCIEKQKETDKDLYCGWAIR